MTNTVLLFAGVREVAGSDRLSIELPAGATYGDLLAKLASELPAARAAIELSRLAADGKFVVADAAVREGGEIALIPPVSGG